MVNWLYYRRSISQHRTTSFIAMDRTIEVEIDFTPGPPFMPYTESASASPAPSPFQQDLQPFVTFGAVLGDCGHGTIRSVSKDEVDKFLEVLAVYKVVLLNINLNT